MIEPIRDLNNMCCNSRKGLQKRWLLKDKTDYSKMCDFMQKINFSIQDLNTEISLLENAETKTIVYVIILVVWIQEAFEKIEKLYRDDVMQDFSYSKDIDLKNAKKYIDAIRSFAVAHPLSTNRHPQFGFDGNYICVDIRDYKRDITAFSSQSHRVKHLDFNGLQASQTIDCDFYFYVYSNKDDRMKHFYYMGCNFDDIYQVARLYIDKLYALDKYLRKLKINDYR
ncbi:MAG: hypothetical protein ACI4KD_09355 [Oscillospiraceae bacterium]